MSAELYGFLGSVVAGAVAIVIAIVRTKGAAEAGDKSASATEVEKLGARLDKQNERLDKQDSKIANLEKRDRIWRKFFEDHYAEHTAKGWPPFDLPEELA